MPIMLAMIPSPSTTSTMMAPKLMISKMAAIALSIVLPDIHRLSLHLLPVTRLFEGIGGAVDRFLVEMATDQHQPHRQPVDHPAGHRHRGMVGNVERRGIDDHFQRALNIFLAAGVRRR